MTIPLEICINADEVQTAERSVRAAYNGGADRIELCRRMDVQGLTPSVESIKAARRAFGVRELLVMIRPRPGDFDYSSNELDEMYRAIDRAARAGADGVVFGVVRQGKIDQPVLTKLVSLARSFGLVVTFHRAFDALDDSLAAVDELIGLGVRRVLSAGEPWGKSAPLQERCGRLLKYIHRTGLRLEWIVGGGIGAANVGTVLEALSPAAGKISIHAYSSVLKDGLTDRLQVQRLRELL